MIYARTDTHFLLDIYDQLVNECATFGSTGFADDAPISVEAVLER